MERKLFYRILPSRKYTPPTVNSNGVQIGEFEPKRWYFLGIEHDKPFISRATLSAVINNGHPINLHMDYPKFDKSHAKFTSATICSDFVGQCTSFMLFEEQLNNTKRLAQLQT